VLHEILPDLEVSGQSHLLDDLIDDLAGWWCKRLRWS
jgi:hypothetical protein